MEGSNNTNTTTNNNYDNYNNNSNNSNVEKLKKWDTRTRCEKVPNVKKNHKMQSLYPSLCATKCFIFYLIKY